MRATRTVFAFRLGPLPDVLVAVIRLLALLVDLLADDWDGIVAADGDGDGTTAVLVPGEEGEAGAVVAVRVPRFDPGVGVGADAVEFDVGGVGKVGAVDLGEDTALFTAGAFGLVVGDLVLEEEEVALGVRADVAVHRRARTVMALDGLAGHVDVLGDGRLALVLLGRGLGGGTLVFSDDEGSESGNSKSDELHVVGSRGGGVACLF